MKDWNLKSLILFFEAINITKLLQPYQLDKHQCTPTSNPTLPPTLNPINITNSHQLTNKKVN